MIVDISCEKFFACSFDLLENFLHITFSLHSEYFASLITATIDEMFMVDDVIVLLYLALHHLYDWTFFFGKTLLYVSLAGCFFGYSHEYTFCLESLQFVFYLEYLLVFGDFFAEFAKSDIFEYGRRSLSFRSCFFVYCGLPKSVSPEIG